MNLNKEFENELYSLLEEHITMKYIDESKNSFGSEWAKFASNEITYSLDENRIHFYINDKLEFSVPLKK